MGQRVRQSGQSLPTAATLRSGITAAIVASAIARITALLKLELQASPSAESEPKTLVPTR